MIAIERYEPTDEPPYEETGWYIACRDDIGLDWEWGPYSTYNEAERAMSPKEPK